MAWTVVDEGSATDITAALFVRLNIVSGKDIAVGSLVVVCIFDRSTGAPGSLADSKGNSYSLINSVSPAGTAANGLALCYYSVLATALTNAGADSITYTKGVGGTVNAGMSVVAASNPVGAPILDTAVNATANGTGTATAITSGVPVVAGELFFEWIGSNGLEAWTLDTAHGWAVPPASFSVTSCAGCGGNQVNAGTGTKTGGPTLGTSRAWGLMTFGFNPSLVPAPATGFNMPMLGF